MYYAQKSVQYPMLMQSSNLILVKDTNLEYISQVSTEHCDQTNY